MKMLKITLGTIFAALIIFLPSFSAQASTQDFYFSSFDAQYTLAKDAENRSTAKVVETLVAVFPNINQNHGIERAIPNTYNNHPVSLKIHSITKQDGSAWNYTTYESNNNTVLRIGDADTYVQGEQTYVISYSMRDITATYDTGDEFYWNINGTQWSQQFNSVTTSVVLEPSVVDAYDGRVACFTGTSGSTESNCTISQSDTSSSIVLRASTNGPLDPYENLSIAVGFKAGTFNPYVAPPTPWWVYVLLFVVVPILYIALPIALFIWALKKWRAGGRDAKSKTTVIPQYLPAKDISMLRSDVIIHTAMQPKAVTATIIDLAVRHYLKIYETDKNKYDIEISKDTSDVLLDEREVLAMLFDNNLTIGNRISLKDKQDLYTKVATLGKDAYASAIADGYMVDTRSVQKKMYLIGGLLIVLALLTINPLLVIACIATLLFAFAMPARTPSGVDLKTYLEGTKMYMEVAEADRLKMLQAPDTVTKVDTQDKTQLVKLYERLLPLAILYGIEKKWAEQFAELYTVDNQPSWYAGNYSAFNAAVFAGSIASFGNSTLSTFAPPASSGGSGFSGGGGSSGGGGGGGGGGGW